MPGCASVLLLCAREEEFCFSAGQGGARQLEVSLKGIGLAMSELQTVWNKIAPQSSW